MVWVKTALENEFRCLPIAKIHIESEKYGNVVTKALGKSVEMNHYLLGNYTQEIIDELKSEPQHMNAMITRSQARKVEECEPQSETPLKSRSLVTN